MAALAGMSGWIAGGVIVAAVSAVAVGSLVLRETSRARIAALPSTETAKPQARPMAAAKSAGPRHEPGTARPVPANPDETEPAFDVVRLEPGGAAVVAGHGAPKVRVALLDGDRVVDQVVSDADGQFVFTPPPLSPGPHLLRLAPAGGAASRSVRVDVKPAIAAAARPAAAVPSKPEPKPATAALEPPTPAMRPSSPEPPPVVAFRTLEIEPGGAFVVTGSGAAGHVLRVYLNGSFVVAVRPRADGSWSVRVEKGMRPGRYEVRADDVHGADAKVLSTAGTSFEYAGSEVAGPAVLDDPGKAASPSPAPGETASTSPGKGTSRPGPNSAPPPAEAARPPTSSAAPADSAPASAVPEVVAASEPPAPVTAATSSSRRARPPTSAPRSPTGKVIRPGPAPRVPPPLAIVARVRPAPPMVQRPPLAQKRADVIRIGHGKVPIRAKTLVAGAPRIRPKPYRVVVVAPSPLAYGGASDGYGPLIPDAVPAARMAGGTWQASVPPLRRPTPLPAYAVVPTIRTVVVRPGDTLWRLSERAYGSGAKFSRVVQANPGVISNPQIIVTGQRLVLPDGPGR